MPSPDGLMKSDGNLCNNELACTTSLTLERDTSNILGEGFPDLGDTLVSSNMSKVCSIAPGSQPSDSTECYQQEDRTCNLSALPLNHANFPKFAQMFIAAIKKNRSCQKFIRSKIIQIEARIEENKELKERVKCIMDFQVSCKRKAAKLISQLKDPRAKLISLPKSRILNSEKVKDKKVHASCLGPTENNHVPNYKMVLMKFPVSLSRQRWSKVEKENLAKGIKQQFQEVLLQKSMEQYSDLEGSSGEFNDLDSIIASITNLEITPENIRCFLPQVDWERLVSMYVMGRSGAECETRWLNHEDPLINHNPWTNLEDKNLLFIVQQRGIYNWIEIATSMGKGRTPFQCLSRYQRSLNAYILKRDWTVDEDAQLRAVVETLGEHDWQGVATAMGGRTGPQCSNRWRKTLHPSRQRVGRWAVDEDKRLKISVMLFGPKLWNKIAKFIPGRTQVQCRERWFNTLDPSLNLGPWSEEEDAKLKAEITEHGYCWSKIAACVPGRTDSQCRRRWKNLFPHEVPLLQAARKIQKAALISNFVDREEQRPALGPCDFVSASLEINSLSEYGNKSSKAKRRKKSCDDPQPSNSRKSRNAKTPIVESTREKDGGDDVTSHGDKNNFIPKKRTKKKLPKAQPNGTMCDDASLDGNSSPKDISQVSKLKKSRTKHKVSTQKEVSELECNSTPKKRAKKKPPKAHANEIQCVESVESYRDLPHPQSGTQNAILSTVENDASLDGNLRPKNITQESKFRKSMIKRKKCRQDVAEYDDDTTLASVFCDIVKRRKLKHATNDIVSDQAADAFPMRTENRASNLPFLRDIRNRPAEDQPCQEDSIVRVIDSVGGSVQHGSPNIDDSSQQDTMRNSSTNGKFSCQEPLIMMDAIDSFVADQAIGMSPEGNTISRKQQKSYKLAWRDKRVHPIEDCEALPLVGQSVLETMDTSTAILDGRDASLLKKTVLFGEHKLKSPKRPEIVSGFSESCCIVGDEEVVPQAAQETAILWDSEAQLCDGLTPQLPSTGNMNPLLPEKAFDSAFQSDGCRRNT
ncbi:hypothetical protein AAC387_Pa05g3209 [Persea americana]